VTQAKKQITPVEITKMLRTKIEVIKDSLGEVWVGRPVIDVKLKNGNDFFEEQLHGRYWEQPE